MPEETDRSSDGFFFSLIRKKKERNDPDFLLSTSALLLFSRPSVCLCTIYFLARLLVRTYIDVYEGLTYMISIEMDIYLSLYTCLFGCLYMAYIDTRMSVFVFGGCSIVVAAPSLLRAWSQVSHHDVSVCV